MKASVLITGSTGMLGQAAVSLLGNRGLGLSHEALDIADADAVSQAFTRFQPQVVFNCAASTNVDLCQTDHTYADSGNVTGPANLAMAARASGALMVHVSTDFVFDGEKGAPYTEHDEPRPLNYYGASKLEGERRVLSACPAALVVRTSWSYGPGGVNFPGRVIHWATEGRRLRAAQDQIGSPTYTPFLARGILQLLEAGAVGVVHLAGAGQSSRFEVAEATLQSAGRKGEVERAHAIDFPARAPRPRNTALDCSLAASLGVSLPPWREGINAYVGTRQDRPSDPAVSAPHQTPTSTP